MEPATYSDLSHDFLFAKLHGMWAKAVAGSRLDALLTTTGSGALRRLLVELGIDITERAGVQKGLTLRFIRDLGSVMTLLDEKTGEFYRRLIDRFFLENLKTILHYRLFPNQDVEIGYLLIDSPFLPEMDPAALIAARSVHRFYAQLPEHEFKRELLPILVEVDDTHDMFVAEAKIDRLYYDGILNQARRLPRRVRSVAVELLGTEIDILNLVTVLRNVELYRLPFETLRELYLPGGRHLDSPDRFESLDTREDVIAALPAPYRKALQRFRAEELYVLENALWNSLHAVASQNFKNYDRPARSVVTFPFLKRFEALNIGRVFEGLHFGLTPTTVRSMLIGEQHA